VYVLARNFWLRCCRCCFLKFVGSLSYSRLDAEWRNNFAATLNTQEVRHARLCGSSQWSHSGFIAQAVVDQLSASKAGSSKRVLSSLRLRVGER
jgi:hypothetical protein